MGIAGCDGDLSPNAGPAVPPGVHLLVRGEARLAGTGDGTACSHGEPASGDGHRWCAFYRPAPEEPSRTELWVVDITRAMAGEAVACDGTSPACLRLTEHLFTEFRFESLSHPEAHRFEGDTLFFLGLEQPGGKERDRFEGLVWVWRPGWTRARAITTDRGVLCRGSNTSATATCVDGASDKPLQFDLRAGRIVDSDNSLLPVVERIAPLRDDDIAWSAFFSLSGDVLAFSSWRDGETSETLRVISTEDLGAKAPRAVIENGAAWMLSRDGRAVFFKRDRSPNRRVGTLWSADFPSGQHATELARGVFDFELVGAEGVAFRTEIRDLEGVLQVIPDRRRPDRRFTLTRDAHAWYPLDSGRFTYILRVREAEERGFIGDSERGSTCGLESRADVTVFGAKLLSNLGLVSWSEPNPNGDELDLTFLGRPEDCGSRRVLGTGITLLQPIGSKGLAFGSKRDLDGRSLTFRYVAVLDDRPVDSIAQVVLDHVDPSNVGRAGDGPDALLLGTLDSAPDGKGLFVFGPLGRARASSRR